MLELLENLIKFAQEDYFSLFILLIILAACLSVPAIIFVVIFFSVLNKRYKKFVLTHSVAIKKLKDLNSKYAFCAVDNFDLINSYDNEDFYNNISAKDYLTYQLVYIKKGVKTAIANADYNKKLYAEYSQAVKDIRVFGNYDVENLPKYKDMLIDIEEKIFDKLLKNPVRAFCIEVELVLTKINGEIRDTKTQTFDSLVINNILEKLSEKSGDYYLDEGVWNSICNVERGRVSNKMRFAIYKRDNYRCRKCGRSTNDLEIDHIFPVSKGGKSTYDNLQTLCHRCNSLKSNTVERGVYNTSSKQKDVKFCPTCGAQLVFKRGKYGNFYGCTNYPNCKYTEKA